MCSVHYRAITKMILLLRAYSISIRQETTSGYNRQIRRAQSNNETVEISGISNSQSL